MRYITSLFLIVLAIVIIVSFLTDLERIQYRISFYNSYLDLYFGLLSFLLSLIMLGGAAALFGGYLRTGYVIAIVSSAISTSFSLLAVFTAPHIKEGDFPFLVVGFLMSLFILVNSGFQLKKL